MKRSAPEINQTAAEWAAKVDAGHLAPSEQEELDAWLAEDARHMGAYAHVQAVLARFERIGAAAGSQSLRLGVEPDRALTRRAMVLTGAAASVAVLATGAGLTWKYLPRRTYATRIGETQIIPLMDGSVVTLNTNSKVSVDYGKSRREIRLIRGEALFDVAKSKKWPFIVIAGDTQVRAVGTSFTVKLLPSAPVQVLVQEGVVEVRRPDIPQVAPVRVSINSKAVAPVDAPIETRTVEPNEVSRDLAWRMGRIAFDNVTLKDAAEEFARYSEIPILVDPVVADQTITGLFVSNDPVGFARAAAISLRLRANISEREVRITR